MANNLLYALACVIVPIAWGLLVVQVVGFIEKRLGKTGKAPENAVAQDDRP